MNTCTCVCINKPGSILLQPLAVIACFSGGSHPGYHPWSSNFGRFC
ncbi:hypothetical protein HanPSC8_Chr17g0748151 [Helianthus annuus]|nr:hypothetical protein HanPSC8_Chr17g0748151 [Helianthus annuus]